MAVDVPHQQQGAGVPDGPQAPDRPGPAPAGGEIVELFVAQFMRGQHRASAPAGG